MSTIQPRAGEFTTGLSQRQHLHRAPNVRQCLELHRTRQACKREAYGVACATMPTNSKPFSSHPVVLDHQADSLSGAYWQVAVRQLTSDQVTPACPLGKGQHIPCAALAANPSLDLQLAAGAVVPEAGYQGDVVVVGVLWPC